MREGGREGDNEGVGGFQKCGPVLVVGAGESKMTVASSSMRVRLTGFIMPTGATVSGQRAGISHGRAAGVGRERRAQARASDIETQR